MTFHLISSFPEGPKRRILINIVNPSGFGSLFYLISLQSLLSSCRSFAPVRTLPSKTTEGFLVKKRREYIEY